MAILTSERLISRFNRIIKHFVEVFQQQSKHDLSREETALIQEFCEILCAAYPEIPKDNVPLTMMLIIVALFVNFHHITMSGDIVFLHKTFTQATITLTSE